MMDTKSIPFDLPNMRVNPFTVKPLTSNDKQLLIGRKEVISKIVGWCKHRSARMVLLVGNRGLGRTSLLNILGSEANKHFQFNIFPTQEPMRRLLEELYITVVSDFEVPRLTAQLQENLIRSLPETGRLPILSFDYPNISGSDIADVFKQISQIIRSLDAISIIALTPAQLAIWPQELIDEFDEEIKISSFNSKEIREMVVKRVSSASRGPWNPPPGLIEEIVERTSGHPSESIKLMRKIVHGIKNDNKNDIQLNEILSNISSKISEGVVMSQESNEDDDENYVIQEEIEDEGDDDENYVIQEEIEDDGGEKEYIFEDNLSETIQNTLPKSGFGRLGGRTKNTNEAMRKDGYAVFPSDYETINRNLDPPSLESAILETDDVSLWIDEGMLAKTVFGDEVKSKIEPEVVPLNQGKNSFEGALKEVQQERSVSLSENPYNLNVNRLRRLDDREIKVIKLSSKREISPSDNEMLQILGGIKRTRLSQICNGLHKEGILSVRKMGRSRMFHLSNSAKAQLLAWGIL